MNSISTRRGDSGETSLLYGGRVSKSSRRVDATGLGDDAISSLGFARANCENEFLRDELLEIQRLIFVANAELSTDLDESSKLQQHFQVIDEENVRQLDELLAYLEQEVTLPSAFIIPGASIASSSLDLARCSVRNFERCVVAMHTDGLVSNHALLTWLNRLSDCVFMMARYADRQLPDEIVTGTRRSS